LADQYAIFVGFDLLKKIRLPGVIGNEYPCNFFMGKDFFIGCTRTDMFNDLPLTVPLTIYLD